MSDTLQFHTHSHPKCCATCSAWSWAMRFNISRDGIKPEDAYCPILGISLQGYLQSPGLTKIYCDEWRSEYLNNFVTNHAYYSMLIVESVT